MRDTGIVADGRRRLAAGEAAAAAEAAGEPEPPAPTWLERLMALLPWAGRPDQRLWFRR